MAAILTAPLYIASVAILSGVNFPAGGMPTDDIRVYDSSSSELLLSSLARAASILLFCVPLLYLFRAAQARSERVSGPMIGFVFIGPALFAAQAVIGWIGQTDVSNEFLAQSGSGGDLYTLLDGEVEDSTPLTIAQNLVFPAVLGLIVAMVYVPLQAMRTGLLTRFFATLGMALGVAPLLLDPRVSLLVLALWFLYLGLLFLGRVPNGRPPAWEAGVAIPWPRPGEEPAEPTEAPADVVEGEGAEVSGDGAAAPERDHSARRERARKRKRKRRR